jgi:hypothetical protein
MMKSRFVLRITLCLGLLLFGSACIKPTPPEPHSEIVATVEQAGSGDLSSTAAPQIEDWLRKHRDLAVQVDDLCKPARDNADANWAKGTEGRVCTAAKNASIFYRQYHNPPKPKGDPVGPGLH